VVAIEFGEPDGFTYKFKDDARARPVHFGAPMIP